MFAALRSALVSPGSFFQREAADPGLRDPVLIVAVVAVIGVLSSVPVMRAVLGTVPDAAGPFVLVGLVVGTVVGFAGPFVVWLLYSLLFYGLSALFGGDGEFRDVFALVGWGFAPEVVSSVVGGVVTVLLLSQGDFSTPQQAQQFSQLALNSPLGLVNRGVNLAMTLWSAWLWLHAVAAARNLSRRAAAATVGVVVLAAVVLGLVSAVLATSGAV